MASAECKQLLRRNPVLASAGDRNLEHLAAASEARHFEPGVVVTRFGMPQTHVLVIAVGELALSKKNRATRSQMLMGILRAPALLGDAELYGRAPWSITATTTKPTTIVAIPNEVFDRAVREDLQLAYGLYKDASCRHLLVIYLMQVMALQTTGHRILRLLMQRAAEQHARKDPPLGEHVIRVDTMNLARAVGVNRKTVARTITGLEQRGLLRRLGRDKVSLPATLDIATLRDLGEFGFGAAWRLP
jgi:CRP-like cAMP-binding protein